MIHQLSLKVDNQPGCLRRIVGVLAERGINLKALEVTERGGGLAAILAVLAEGRINVRYMYAFLGRVASKSLAVFSVDEIPRAQRALAAAGVTLFSQSELREEDAVKIRFRTSLEDHFGKDFIW